MKKRKNDQITLGNIYGDILKKVRVVSESNNAQENINKSKKISKSPENAFTKQNKLTDGGPKERGGFHKALNDDCSCEEDDEREYPKSKNQKTLDNLKAKLASGVLPTSKEAGLKKEIARLEKALQGEEAEESLQENRKIARNRLNNFMSKKSTFDKLFESVMGDSFDSQEDNQEIDALGLGDAPTDDEFGDDEFSDEGEQVTLTIDRSVAQQLLDLLQTAVGGGDEEFGDDDLDFEDEEDDFGDDDMDFDEDEERGVHPTDKVGNDGTTGPKNSKDGAHKFQSKSNKVGGRPTASGQGTKVVGVTDKVGNDGDYGHALHGAKQPNIGKQNKVSDLRQATDFFR